MSRGGIVAKLMLYDFDNYIMERNRPSRVPRG